MYGSICLEYRHTYPLILFWYPLPSCFSSIQYVLSNIDNCIQYGEDADVKVRDYIPEGDDDW
jgi:hypothetical protein